MEADFWHQRWERGEIGFHKSRVNPLLIRWWPALGDVRSVLVPLCGKSLDMLWLCKQGLQVMGVELSRQALEAFAEENVVPLHWQHTETFDIASAPGLQLYAGDFFAADYRHLAGVEAVYDRAALIALPQHMRLRYIEHLRSRLPPGWQMLLVTLDYDQSERAGPPFSVDDAEIHMLFAGCQIEQLAEADVLEDHQVFREQGITRLFERVYRIRDTR